MADWDEPTDIDDPYADILEFLKDRDLDATTMFLSTPENPPHGSIRWNRTSFTFQEYDSVANEWDNLDISAGFTVGSMGSQDADNVAIVGGSIGGSVDIDASRLTLGEIDPERLASGTPSAATFLAGDQVWRQPVPIGAGSIWFTNAAPTGWLICDGSAVSRATYSALFAIIGEIYGAGNGTTTFNLPDLRGRFPFGKAATGTGSTLADDFGLIDHVHTGPAHTHTGPSHSHTYTDVVNHTHAVNVTDPGHKHTIATDGAAGILAPAKTVGGAGATTQDTSTVVTGVTAVTVAPAGGVATGNTAASGTGPTGSSGTGDTGVANPPGLVINFIIKAA